MVLTPLEREQTLLLGHLARRAFPTVHTAIRHRNMHDKNSMYEAGSFAVKVSPADAVTGTWTMPSPIRAPPMPVDYIYLTRLPCPWGEAVARPAPHTTARPMPRTYQCCTLLVSGAESRIRRCGHVGGRFKWRSRRSSSRRTYDRAHKLASSAIVVAVADAYSVR